MQSTWERDRKMRESLFLSPHLLSPKAQSSDVYLACIFWTDPSPGVPQTAPLCLGKHESELIVFKVPWQESDAHSRWFFYLDIGSWERGVNAVPFVSRFCSAGPRCKTGHGRCFIGQWLGDAVCSSVTWRDALNVSKSPQLYLSTHLKPQIDKIIRLWIPNPCRKPQGADKCITFICQSGWSNFKQIVHVRDQQDVCCNLDQPRCFHASLSGKPANGPQWKSKSERMSLEWPQVKMCVSLSLSFISAPQITEDCWEVFHM